MKKLHFFFFLFISVSMCYGQLHTVRLSQNYKQTAKGQPIPIANDAKANWYGANNYSTNIWFTGGTDYPTGGGEFFFRGDKCLSSAATVYKVRFFHYVGQLNFSPPPSGVGTVNFDCTSYTITLYNNINTQTSPFLYIHALPTSVISSTTITIPTNSNGIQEVVLQTPYNWNGTSAFLVGVRFNNGIGTAKMDTVAGVAVAGTGAPLNGAGEEFFAKHPTSAFGLNPGDAGYTDLMNLAQNGSVLYDLGVSNGYKDRFAIELCTDAPNTNIACDMEATAFYNVDLISPYDTTIGATTAIQYGIYADNHGPDIAIGDLSYTCLVGSHSLLANNPSVLNNVNIQPYSTPYSANFVQLNNNTPVSLNAAQMNAMGLVNFSILTNVQFTPTTGVVSDPNPSNNTHTYTVHRTIPMPTNGTFFPANGDTDILNNTNITLTFPGGTTLVLDSAVLNGISISPSPGGVSWSVSGNVLTINHSPLSWGTLYQITVPTGAFKYNLSNTNAGTQQYQWSFTTLYAPNCATLIGPNGAQLVPITTTLDWNTPTVIPNSYGAATSFDFYFGTVTPPPLMQNLPASTTTSSPSLDYGRTYYWKIVPKNTAGDASGCNIWSFTTENAPIVKPYCATFPVPSSASSGIATTNVTISWAAVTGATGYKVHFGTTNPPPQIMIVSSPSYTIPTPMTNGQTYYWQIRPYNEVGEADGPCEIWSFTTETSSTVTCAQNPVPAHHATNIAINYHYITWANVSGATSYNVLFGTSQTPDFVITTSAESYLLPPLTPNTTYYWKIVPKIGSVAATGCPVWEFTTGTSTSLSDYETNGFLIYPNPSNGTVNIIVNETSDIKIHDLTGRLIDAFIVKASETKTFHISAGTYFVNVNEKVEKIVIEQR